MTIIEYPPRPMSAAEREPRLVSVEGFPVKNTRMRFVPNSSSYIGGDAVVDERPIRVSQSTHDYLTKIKKLGWFNDASTYALFSVTNPSVATMTDFKIMFDIRGNDFSLSLPTESELPVLAVDSVGIVYIMSPQLKRTIASSVDTVSSALMERFRGYGELELENGWNPILLLDALTLFKYSWGPSEIQLVDKALSNKVSLTLIAQLITAGYSTQDAVEIAEAKMPLSYLINAFFTFES